MNFRAGFYAENLLLYSKIIQDRGKLPLPIGKTHRFAPLALGDLANLAAVVLVGQGPHGFDDRERYDDPELILLYINADLLCKGAAHCSHRAPNVCWR